MAIRAVHSVEVLRWSSEVTQSRLSTRVQQYGDADMTKRPQHRLHASHYKSAHYRWPPKRHFFLISITGNYVISFYNTYLLNVRASMANTSSDGNARAKAL